MAGEPEDVEHLLDDGQHRALDRLGRRRDHGGRSDAADLARGVARDGRVPAPRDEHTRAPWHGQELRRRRGMPEQNGAFSVEQRHGDGGWVEARPRRARGRLVEGANEREHVVRILMIILERRSTGGGPERQPAGRSPAIIPAKARARFIGSSSYAMVIRSGSGPGSSGGTPGTEQGPAADRVLTARGGCTRRPVCRSRRTRTRRSGGCQRASPGAASR